jgi:hypothetical protein
VVGEVKGDDLVVAVDAFASLIAARSDLAMSLAVT